LKMVSFPTCGRKLDWFQTRTEKQLKHVLRETITGPFLYYRFYLNFSNDMLPTHMQNVSQKMIFFRVVSMVFEPITLVNLL
jgi:hypothetical protein